MDPNAALEQINILMGEIDNLEDDATDREKQLVELLFGLFEWIERGGFLPEEWQSERELWWAKKLIDHAQHYRNAAAIYAMNDDKPMEQLALARALSIEEFVKAHGCDPERVKKSIDEQLAKARLDGIREAARIVTEYTHNDADARLSFSAAQSLIVSELRFVVSRDTIKSQ